MFELNLRDMQVRDPTAFSISERSSWMLQTAHSPRRVLEQNSARISAEAGLSRLDLCSSVPFMKITLLAMSSGTSRLRYSC